MNKIKPELLAPAGSFEKLKQPFYMGQMQFTVVQVLFH